MTIQEQVLVRIAENETLIKSLAKEIGEHPELGFVEKRASELLTNTLKDEGYKVQLGVGGLETAFIATKGEAGPNIALLCEYDALPGIGHGCGHNLIGAASVGAAIGLSAVLADLGGKVSVIGAPGEETGGGKTILVKEGVFAEVDAAMMFHPSSATYLMSTSNALDALEFVFKGKTAHAAGSPEKGINALDGVILMFNGINALRQHVRDDVRIHGIITEGGKAANVVPDRAVAQFYVRAGDRKYLDCVVEKVQNIANGASLMTGAEVTWRSFEYSNDNLIPNKVLAQVFGQALEKLGVKEINEFHDGKGSSDMGNVSQVVPAIHPYIMVDPDIVGHTADFAEKCLGERGQNVAVLAAKALGLTVCELLEKPEIVCKAKEEHVKSLAHGFKLSD